MFALQHASEQEAGDKTCDSMLTVVSTKPDAPFNIDFPVAFLFSSAIGLFLTVPNQLCLGVLNNNIVLLLGA